MPRWIAASLVLATATLASSCAMLGPKPAIPQCEAPRGDPFACGTVDDLPVGPHGVNCAEAPCEFLDLALTGLPDNHPAVIAAYRYDFDMSRVCGPTLCLSSNLSSIYIFRLADGSTRGVSVGCVHLGGPDGECRVIPRRQ
jgi:hypothetical protein